MTRLLLNPGAGRGGGRRLAAALAGAAELSLIVPDSAEAVTDEARRAARAGHDRVLVAGGDGTLHFAIRGLAGTSCALGIVPMGTGNDLARALGVPLDPLLAVRRSIAAEPRRVDLGSIDGNPFAGVAAMGFDGEVARFARERLQSARGRWIYLYATLRMLIAFRPPRVRIESDGGRFEGRAMLASVANSPCYGGGMRIAPAAALDDGMLDLVVVERVSRARFLRLFPRVYRGAHVRLPEVRTMRIRHATLVSDPPLTFFADGEPLAICDTSRAEVWPSALAVVV